MTELLDFNGSWRTDMLAEYVTRMQAAAPEKREELMGVVRVLQRGQMAADVRPRPRLSLRTPASVANGFELNFSKPARRHA